MARAVPDLHAWCSELGTPAIVEALFGAPGERGSVLVRDPETGLAHLLAVDVVTAEADDDRTPFGAWEHRPAGECWPLRDLDCEAPPGASLLDH